MVNITVVIGANYGDEGKGHMVDYFADKAVENGRHCLVVLSNGGPQRGHTVCTPDDTEHIFKHFGSGMLAGADTLIPKTFIVNPMFFEQERKALFRKGRSSWANIYLTTSCMMTTPYEMIANMLIEDARGDQRHGSCGCGIWETIVRGGVKVSEFLGMTHMQRVAYLKFVRDDYLYDRLSRKGVKVDEQWNRVLKSDVMIENYIADFNSMIGRSILVDDYPCDTVYNYKEVIFENGQGLAIGEEYGDTKYGTPSHTGLKNPVQLIHDYYDNLEDTLRIDVCYVSRTYLTRHGMGPFPEEWDYLKDKQERDLLHETNQTNQYQGELRYARLNGFELHDRCVKDYENNIGDFAPISRWFVALTHVDEGASDSLYVALPVKYESWGHRRDAIHEYKDKRLIRFL